MIRLPLDEALVSISGILVSLFVQEQLPESYIQQIVVGDVAARYYRDYIDSFPTSSAWPWNG